MRGKNFFWGESFLGRGKKNFLPLGGNNFLGRVKKKFFWRSAKTRFIFWGGVNKIFFRGGIIFWRGAKILGGNFWGKKIFFGGESFFGEGQKIFFRGE